MVFKNINLDTSDIERLQAHINGILNAIDLNISVSKVQLIGGQNNGTFDNKRRKAVLVTFANESQRSDVLKYKRKLKDTNDYKKVYIETDRSRHEQMQEANLRRIVRSIPSLQIRGGRVVEKSD